MDKRFYTLEEVADYLGVNYQLVYRLVKSHELPAVRIGRVYRVEKQQLEDFITKQTTGSKNKKK